MYKLLLLLLLCQCPFLSSCKDLTVDSEPAVDAAVGAWVTPASLAPPSLPGEWSRCLSSQYLLLQSRCHEPHHSQLSCCYPSDCCRLKLREQLFLPQPYFSPNLVGGASSGSRDVPSYVVFEPTTLILMIVGAVVAMFVGVFR